VSTSLLNSPLFAVSTSTVGFWSNALNLVLILVGLFLILVILIQRGKGGGLIGAFGGAGGSSAFGSKAGDFFTRFTIIVAAIWVLLIMVHVRVVKAPSNNSGTGNTTEMTGPEQS
jgi:preprotein translocase subunit SecG